MAEVDEKERVNGGRGVYVEAGDKITLHGVLYALIATVLFPAHTSPAAGESLLRRVKISFSHYVPLIPQASRNSGGHLIHWTRRGSPLRALLVISVSATSFVNRLLSPLTRSSIILTESECLLDSCEAHDTIFD